MVINPDFLVDISSIARCFTDWGHHPLSYTYNRLSPSANSKAILLGHYSGVALDDIINKKEHYSWQESLKKSFSKKALEYCTCGDMNVGDDFKYSAQQQSSNIQQIVDELFHSEKTSFDESKAILEPSFICEELGIQGRVDLMTTDFKLLIEQKSGGNFNIERGIITSMEAIKEKIIMCSYFYIMACCNIIFDLDATTSTFVYSTLNIHFQAVWW